MAVYEAIETQRVETLHGVTSIDFTGFPTSYRHLQLRISVTVRPDGIAQEGLQMRFATTGSYSWQTGSVYTSHGCCAYNNNNKDSADIESAGDSIWIGNRGYSCGQILSSNERIDARD